MTAPDPRLEEIEAKLRAAESYGYPSFMLATAHVSYLLAELRKAQDKLARVSDVLDNWQAEVPFQDAEESQRWYSLGKRHAAERIRFELAGSRAAVADATGGGE